jgi:hypothetical protein
MIEISAGCSTFSLPILSFLLSNIKLRYSRVLFERKLVSLILLIFRETILFFIDFSNTKCYFPLLRLKMDGALKLISWKRSFEILNEEFETVKKKKQALDNLLNTGRISHSTFDFFNREIDEAIEQIEKQRKALLEKMNSKTEELEEQIKTLERLLANFEIQHVSNEVNEEVYQREISLLSIGIENARLELDAIKEAVNKLSSGTQTPTTDITVQKQIEPQSPENVEVSQPEVKIEEESILAVEEKLPEPPVEHVETTETVSSQPPQEEPQEPLQSTEETQSTETNVEGEGKQETQ